MAWYQDFVCAFRQRRAWRHVGHAHAITNWEDNAGVITSKSKHLYILTERGDGLRALEVAGDKIGATSHHRYALCCSWRAGGPLPDFVETSASIARGKLVALPGGRGGAA